MRDPAPKTLMGNTDERKRLSALGVGARLHPLWISQATASPPTRMTTSEQSGLNAIFLNSTLGETQDHKRARYFPAMFYFFTDLLLLYFA